MTVQEIPTVTRFGREEFLTRRWNHGPGEHVTMLAPTQSGKTTFMFDLLSHANWNREFRGIKPHPPLILVMKPRDQVVNVGMKRLKLKRLKTWPPVSSIWKPNVPGYVLWPPHSFDPDVDDVNLRREMRKAVLSCYKQGNRIIIADETFGLINELKLHKEVTIVHSRGAGMGVSIWCMTQKPTHIGTWAYSQAEHLFLAYDPDERARDRFSEIGGVDPKIVKYHVANLKDFEWLYIRRSGRVMCIIESN